MSKVTAVQDPAKGPTHVTQLDVPTPGVVVTVPLMLLMDYMRLYGLEPKGYEHPVLIVGEKDKSTK